MTLESAKESSFEEKCLGVKGIPGIQHFWDHPGQMLSCLCLLFWLACSLFFFFLLLLYFILVFGVLSGGARVFNSRLSAFLSSGLK